MRILVADDEHTSLLIAKMALRKLGYQCDTVADGIQAWDAFCSGRPDVVISDWMMPGLSGLQLCRKFRSHTSGAQTYFIMVSGLGAREQIVEGMDAGADDYLLKPLDIDDLRIRLIAAARVTALHRKLVQQRAELEALNQELAASALRDPLTGLGNRRALGEDLDQMGARATRYGHRYCMALLDVDHFKSLQRHLRSPSRRPDPRNLSQTTSGMKLVTETRSTVTAVKSSCASSPNSPSPWRPWG